MRTKNYLLSGLIMILMWSCGNLHSGLTVVFPEVSEPVQITNNEKEHFLASYYGINNWSSDQKYVTILQTDIKYKLSDKNEPATLGLVDLKTREFIPLTQTHPWNFREGCMANWLGISPDSLIIFNDLRGGKFVLVIINVYTKKEIKIILFPVSAVYLMEKRQSA